MITQREADRRVFQRKQDALHKELREFVEEMSGGVESSARGIKCPANGEPETARRTAQETRIGTPVPPKPSDRVSVLAVAGVAPGPLTPWHMRCWP